MNRFFKILALTGCIVGGALQLGGCTPGQNTAGSTLVGATAGGLVGNALFGSAGGAIAGALIGGIVGNQVGQQMDRQDRINMQSAIVNTPPGRTAQWRNESTDVTYQVIPQRKYHRHGRYCREYRTRIKIDGSWKKGYGKACRKPDGSWHIIS